MKTKTARNSNLNGPYDRNVYYTGKTMDMGGYDLGETSIENPREKNYLVSDVLMDLAVMAYGRVGDVIIRSEMISPEGVSQQDTLKVSIVGSSTAPSTETLMFFGEMLEIKKGDTITTIKGKMMDIFNMHVDNGVFFTGVRLTDVNDISITYKDCRKHNTLEMVPLPHFLSIEVINEVENSSGVGKWEYIGERVEEFGGGTKKSLYYYERIG